MATVITAPTPPQTPARAAAGRAAHSLALRFGVIGFLLSVAGSWIPSFWGDEAASVMSAERPVGNLFALITHVDAVHGLYYLFLHGWIDLFGASEFSVRLPSAIAVGVAAAGTVVLAERLAGRRVALFAGIVFVVLPRVTYMGGETRSYAMGTALAVWCTVLFVSLVRRPTGRRSAWLLYAALVALDAYVFLFLTLLLVAHGAWLLATRPPGVLRRWALAVAAGLTVALPIVIVGVSERHQVAFLASKVALTPERVLINQWFGSPAIAVVCWALICVAVVRFALPGRATPRASTTGLVLAWAVLPPLTLLAVHFFIAPSYSLRYLSFCTPAVAILVALGLAGLSRSLLPALLGPLVLCLLVALVVPGYVAQRGPYAKDAGSDLRQAADYVGAHAVAGDAVLFDASARPSQRPRLELRLYPGDFAGLRDVELVTPFSQRAGLWDVTAPLSSVANAVHESSTVWLTLLTGTADQLSGADLATMRGLGYRVESAVTINRSIVYELVDD